MDMQATDKPEGKRKGEGDELSKKWKGRIEAAAKHWDSYHKRVRYNRRLVSGLDWTKEPNGPDFYAHRANLIHGTITAVLPNIYAKNPEISATPNYNATGLKLFCKTIQTVTNRCLEKARLKHRAKSSVRSALTTSMGIVKVLYQRDIQEDPHIRSRINDTQDNILRIEGLLRQIEDPMAKSDMEAEKLELQQLMAALNEKLEVVAAEGLVIDRVLSDRFLLDPSVVEFFDYADADWMAEIIPMKRCDAEARYNFDLSGAKTYKHSNQKPDDRRIASGSSKNGEDDQIAVVEIWDKATQRIYTMAEGCDFWLREPFSPPKVGERWYPYFILPFQVVDGEVIGPSLVDLTEKLQEEHNEARNRFNKHRDLCVPGYIASSDTSEKNLKNFARSVSVEGFGEIVLLDTEGKPLNQMIAAKQHPPIDPTVYDTTTVRYDWEQVTGMQDAARSTVVQPKTATEASIMNQALSGRVAEFRDQLEDWLQEINNYAAQLLLQELTAPQVERIMGPHGMEVINTPAGSMEVQQPSYDWPELTRDEIFDMIEMRIRAGTTGAPDKLEQQENWTKVMPVITDLVSRIMQTRATGMDATPFENLLRETIKRFDERLEIEDFMPARDTAPQMPPAGMPAEQGATALM